MKTSLKPTTPKKWTTAKRYKVTGSALLLIAFGIQMYQSKASARETMKIQAAELDGRQHLKALGYENLYFSVKAATGQEEQFNLYAAAQQRAVGRISMVATSDEPQEVKASRIRDINTAAKGVHDLASFNDFMRSLQKQLDTARSSELDALLEAGNSARVLWRIYISLYGIGSLSLLRSQYLE
jgi:hypothetical protein